VTINHYYPIERTDLKDSMIVDNQNYDEELQGGGMGLNNTSMM